ncbi:hypothetical protein ILYODFUR_018410, partial [Ilyodon furcidens]
LSLWDNKFLEDNKRRDEQRSSSFQVISSDSLEEKSSFLDVEASLKASFLSGLIEVSGSAKYLNDKKKFKNQSRVILQYKATSYVSKLSMTSSKAFSAGKLSEEVKSMATHVVTSIQYGANAFFVFDSEKLQSTQVQDFQGTLEGAINKIPKLSVEGKISAKLSEKENSLLNNISCKFYGDFLLENNPTSFEDALKVYQSLSKMLREDTNNSVPVKVSLMPLNTYDPSAAAVTGEICKGLVTKAQNVFEDLSHFEMRCNDILEVTALKNFPQIYNSLQKFSDLCKNYENNLRDTMKKKFPLIRAGKEDDSSVEKLLDDRNKSPFSHDNLDRWMSDKEAEADALKICLDAMEGIKISSESQLKKEAFARGVVHTLCFMFTSLENDDPYLDQLESSLHSHDLQSSKNASAAPKRDQWYYSDTLIFKLKNKAQDMQSMAKGLKASVKFRFLIAALKNPKYQGASIYHYKQGILASEDFSKPDVPAVETIRSKEDLIWYACDLTLNPNTANSYLILSEENKKATCTAWQNYPSHPDRFDKPQVLCNEELHGRCYWEVEWSEASYIGVGVAYKSIERQGVYFGDNDKSWYFGQYGGLEAKNKGNTWKVSTPPGGCRIIGVYLDMHGGTLSFYKVSCDKLEHLYTFKTTFNDHVYPGFYIYPLNNYCMLNPVQ